MSNNDLPQTKVAFDIDHILEKILHSLHPLDLLKCRFVCHRWCTIATQELQHTVELAFLGDHLRTGTGRHHLELLQLTRLLNEKSEITRSRFPCQKFEFDTTSNARENGNILSTQLTNFLDIYGINIHSLCIDSHSVPINENVALAELRKLLAEQTPNLKNFLLTLETSEGSDDDALRLGTEFKNSEAYKNKSFKTLYMRTSYKDSLKVLEGVLQLAPNLEELIHIDGSASQHPPAGSGRNYRYRYSCFTKPLKRLHLLKEVRLGPSLLEIESLENIVGASLDTPGTLKLRQVTIDSFNWLGPEETSRFVTVMNHLLDSSSDTLETIKWKNATFLKGMEWGRVMPKLKALRLYINNIENNGGLIFPPGFGLSATFPKLRSVEILYSCDESDFIKFLNSLKPMEVHNSVKRVRIQDSSFDRGASEQVSALLRKLFPKAEIQYPFRELKSAH